MSAQPSPSPSLQERRTKSPLYLLIEGDKQGHIPRFLFHVAGKRGLRGADAEDVVADTLRIAFQREADGELWDPDAENVTVFLARIAVHVLANIRRARVRKPTLQIEDDDLVVSEALNAEELMLEREQAREVQRALAAETQSHLTLRLLDAMKAGVRGHPKLAKHLGCTVGEVRNACKRVRRHAQRVQIQRTKGDAS